MQCRTREGRRAVEVKIFDNGRLENILWFTYALVHKGKRNKDGTVQEVRVRSWASLIFALWCEELMFNFLLPKWAPDVDVHPHASIR